MKMSFKQYMLDQNARASYDAVQAVKQLIDDVKNGGYDNTTYLSSPEQQTAVELYLDTLTHRTIESGIPFWSIRPNLVVGIFRAKAPNTSMVTCIKQRST